MSIKSKKSDKSSNLRIFLFVLLVKIQQILKIFIDRFKPSMEAFWDSHYITGVWDDLRKIEQVPLYSILTGYFKFFKKGGSILDVGCGEGVFLERLDPKSYSKYVGVDISQEAINRAGIKKNKNIFFIREDVYNFKTTETFDAIIFSEMLYYLDMNKILNFMNKYENYLKKDGIFIVSMINNKNTETIRKMLEKVYPILDKTEINNITKHSWICEVFLPSKQLKL